MNHGKSEIARIIVAFGDLIEFTHFDNSVTNPEVEFDPFFREFDDLIDEIESKTGYTFVDTGDGFMCVVDLSPGHNCKLAIKVLSMLWFAQKRIEHMLAKMDSPKPQGFRIRVACGYVKRKVKKSGKVVLRGKHINLAHKMLRIQKNVGFICHESVKSLFSKEQLKEEGIRFTKVAIQEPLPEGIEVHHAKAMWAFDLKRRKE